MRHLERTHDLRLPEWGPYTKKYIGISHIADHEEGIRFDLSVFPGFYRGKVEVPNVLWESGYHPWEAAPDLSYFSHRHELEWKDRVYCDISFSKLTHRAMLVRCECVNRTDEARDLALHYMASLHFPTVGGDWLRPMRVCLPEGAVWVDALDYEDLRFASSRPTDALVPDGRFRGEVRGDGFVEGSGVGQGFGREKGDRVSYCIELAEAVVGAELLFRYRMEAGEDARFSLDGAADDEVRFAAGEGFQTVGLRLGDLPPGRHTLMLTSVDGPAIELDGFAVAPGGRSGEVRFEPVARRPVPEMWQGPASRSMILKYPDVEAHYGIRWEYEPSEVREFHADELDRLMRHTVHSHTRSVFKGTGEGHFLNVFLRPIVLQPQSEETLYGMVCTGGRKEVEEDLAGFGKQSDEWEDLYLSARAHAVDLSASEAGKDYAFSQQRMAATVLTNVVFPVYIRRSCIRHYTPGRWWDSLYTWDSGFIGLGLAELDLERAIDCLNAYTTEPGDAHAAFVHHGSPVPVQIYLFLELWNRTQSRELLAHFYPRLRQYHRFLCGRSGGSTTRRLKSNLIQTWDYFYNSGGWDDYPPQVYVHENGLESQVAPAVNTAHCIRTAKILRMAAEALGALDDVGEYDEDIALFTEALQTHAWDEATGYFGYVRHNEAGMPMGILRYTDGQNYNMGLDGVYPLIAGICTNDQKRRLRGRLMSELHLWTPIGLSTVDRSAPYFRQDGYWNGAVWMPHQWFFWKTMLDLGLPDLAFRIAQCGLALWKAEVERSYNCFEHFVLTSGRGAGWHHFGGLSSPVLSWFGAYYRPGRLTCGFDVWVESRQFSDHNRSMRATLKLYGAPGAEVDVVVTMAPGSPYTATWNGDGVKTTEALDGALEVKLPCDVPEGELVVTAQADT